MALHPTGRCPRCGYVLRYDGYKYSCDFCGYSHTSRTLTGMIQDLERGVKSKLQKLFEAATRTHVGQAVTYYPVTMRQQRPCVVCGVNLPLGIQNCPSCGAVQVITRPSPPSRRNGSETQTLDQRVFDYIVAHAGTISLSQAAQDLSMSPDALRLTIERLKAAGLLSQA